ETPLVDDRACRRAPVVLLDAELLIHRAPDAGAVVARGASDLNERPETGLRCGRQCAVIPLEECIERPRGDERAHVGPDGLAPIVWRDRVLVPGKGLGEERSVPRDRLELRHGAREAWVAVRRGGDERLDGLVLDRCPVTSPMLHE